jgi:hypothetical protein
MAMDTFTSCIVDRHTVHSLGITPVGAKVVAIRVIVAANVRGCDAIDHRRLIIMTSRTPFSFSGSKGAITLVDPIFPVILGPKRHRVRISRAKITHTVEGTIFTVARMARGCPF